MNSGAIHQIQTPRKAYHQTAVDTQGPYFDRASSMAEASRAALEFFESLASVDWLTLEFRVLRHGTEDPGIELWRWEVWIKG